MNTYAFIAKGKDNFYTGFMDACTEEYIILNMENERVFCVDPMDFLLWLIKEGYEVNVYDDNARNNRRKMMREINK